MDTAALRLEERPDLTEVQNALGWPGILLEDIRLFDQSVCVVANPNNEAIRWRLDRDMQQSVLDFDTLTLWELEQDEFPASPLAITGILLRDSACRRPNIITRGRRWLKFFSTTLVLDELPSDTSTRLECQYHDLGLAVTSSSMTAPRILVNPPPARQALRRRRPIDRWIEEYVFGHCFAQERLGRFIG